MENQFLHFIEVLKQVGLEWYHKYYSVYPAKVEDNNDPEERGRILISLPSILNEKEVLDIWCEPYGQTLAGNQCGGFFPPYKGEIVDVMFENGDIHFPRYLGGFWAKADLPDVFTSGYGETGPTIRGWAFKSGQQITIDETADALKLQLVNGNTGGVFTLDDTKGSEGVSLLHKSGSLFQMSSEGNIIFATPSGDLLFLNDKTGEVTLKSKAGSIVTLSDTVVISEASGKNIITITDSSVEVNSSSDVIVTAASVNVNAGSVALGKGASDNAVLYSKLKDLFDNHLHLTSLGPSMPPLATGTMSFAESIPTMSAKANNITLKGNTP